MYSNIQFIKMITIYTNKNVIWKIAKALSLIDLFVVFEKEKAINNKIRVKTLS